MGDQNELWLPARFGRRQLIMGAGAAAILAACGGDDDKASTATNAPPASDAATGDTSAPPATSGDTTATAAPSPDTTGAPAGDGKPGGTLRVGVVGSTNDIIDGQYIVARADQARTVAGWESIANYDT